jgi:hypothetical protein
MFISSALFSLRLGGVEKSSHSILHIPRQMGRYLIWLYSGPGIAYNSANAHRGNLKKGRKTMTTKKTAAKKLQKGKKLQPTKTLRK